MLNSPRESFSQKTNKSHQIIVKNSRHRPPHILVNHSWYFITSHTLESTTIQNSGMKKIWINTLHKLSIKYGLKIKAWVVLDNHYHLLVYINIAEHLPKLINHLQGSTSHQFNKVDNQQNRKVWYSYWDRIIRDEDVFWTKFNYIHYNPVKHGYVKTPEAWKYSTYHHYLTIMSQDWIDDCWEAHPVVEFNYE